MWWSVDWRWGGQWGGRRLVSETATSPSCLLICAGQLLFCVLRALGSFEGLSGEVENDTAEKEDEVSRNEKMRSQTIGRPHVQKDDGTS